MLNGDSLVFHIFGDMCRIFILLIFFSLALPRTDTAQIEEDKAKHFVAGALIGTAGGLIASEISNKNTFWIITGAVGTSLLAGAVKEAIDANSDDNSWSNGDLAATGLGGLTAGVTISIFTGKSKRKKATQVNLQKDLNDPLYLSGITLRSGSE